MSHLFSFVFCVFWLSTNVSSSFAPLCAVCYHFGLFPSNVAGIFAGLADGLEILLFLAFCCDSSAVCLFLFVCCVFWLSTNVSSSFAPLRAIFGHFGPFPLKVAGIFAGLVEGLEILRLIFARTFSKICDAILFALFAASIFSGDLLPQSILSISFACFTLFLVLALLFG